MLSMDFLVTNYSQATSIVFSVFKAVPVIKLGSWKVHKVFQFLSGSLVGWKNLYTSLNA